MTSRRRSPGSHWWASRFHPLSRYGYDIAKRGSRHDDNLELWTGLIMIVGGFVLRRKKSAPQRIYRTGLTIDESLAIQVVQNGEVVSETVVQGQET